jgi:predicted kinase
MTEKLSQQSAEKPMLIFKIGVLGCTPLDMPARLAEEFGARLVSSDAIRKEMIDERDAGGMPPVQAQRIDSKKLRRVQAARASSELRNNHDVMMDIFYNTPNSRRVPLEICERVGAVSVALWINTPFELAIRRVEEWTAADSFVTPVSRWEIPPVQAAKTMMNHVEWPQHEGIDHVFNLDGTAGTVALIDQFEAHMQRTGLIV